jgi:hypothetical protein
VVFKDKARKLLEIGVTNVTAAQIPKWMDSRQPLFKSSGGLSDQETGHIGYDQREIG